MALAGLKKQFNKANQYMSEKIGGAEGTKFTEEFSHLERKTDLTNELVEELLNKTKEYLQPNPASRTKLMVSSKLKGVPGKPHSYPQPEGTLGEVMCKFGKELGEDSNFARSLVEMGEAMRELSEVKYSLEDNVKQNFLEPLTHMQAKDLKDVLFHRKKLEGRRLDFDCKRRKRTKGTHISEDEIKQAEDKLEESFNLASMGMHNLLQNEIEQLSQICTLAEALYEYHSQCANVLESLNARLMEIKSEASDRTFQPYEPKKLSEINLIAPLGADDMSPGEAMLNGSRLSTNINNTRQPLHASSQSLGFNKPTRPAPKLHPSSSWSSKSSTISVSQPGNTLAASGASSSLSTTQYLLSTKQSNNKSDTGTVNFSTSNPNLNDWDALSFDTTTPPIISDTPSAKIAHIPNSNVDLLGSLEDDFQTINPSVQTSFPSSDHPSKPNNLFLDTTNVRSGRSPNASPLHSPIRSPARTPENRGPCAQALYDFTPENETELGFREGDVITLISQIDDNWFEGTIRGKSGLFPVSYVQVLVPLQANGR